MRLTAFFRSILLALPLTCFAQLEGDALAIVNAINENTSYLRTVVDNTGTTADDVFEYVHDTFPEFKSDLITLLNTRFTSLEASIANNATRITDSLRLLQTDLSYVRAHNAHIEKALYESHDGNGYGTGKTIFQEVRSGFASVTNMLMRNIQAMQPLTLLTNIYVNQLNLGNFNPNIQEAEKYVDTIFSNSQSLKNMADVSYYMAGFPNGGNPALFLPTSYGNYTIYEFDGDLLDALETTESNLGSVPYEPAYGYAYYRLFGTYDLLKALEGTSTNAFDKTLPDDDVQDAQLDAGRDAIRSETGDDEPDDDYQTEEVVQTEDATYEHYFESLRRYGTDDSDYKAVSDELEQKIQDVSSSIDDILPKPKQSANGSSLVIPYSIDLSGIFGPVETAPPELSVLQGNIDLTVTPEDIKLFHFGFRLIGWVARVSMFFYTGIQLFNFLAAGLAGQVAKEQQYRDALDEI